MLMNGVGVSFSELETHLSATKVRDPKFSVMIKGDAKAPYAGVIAVVDLVTRLEIENVGLVTAKIGS